LDDPDLTENRDRVIHKDKFLPQIIETFKSMTKAELMEKIENLGLPFAPIGKPEELFDDPAPIGKPEELFDDPHLNTGGGLLDMEMEDGQRCKLPALPIGLDGQQPSLRLDPPKAGEHTEEILEGLGLDIDTLKNNGVI